MKYIGKPQPTVDAIEKVTGTTIYGDDIFLPNMLYGKVLASNCAHAKIINIDTTEAEKLEGVRAVITYKDCPQNRYNRIMRWSKDELPATELIFDQYVRYVGDKVAAVAADTIEIAKKAIQLIKVEYEELPAVFDPEEALDEKAPQIYPTGNLLKELILERGNVNDAFSQAYEYVENETSTSMIHHAAIEPHVCIGQWTKNGELYLWGPQQGVHRAQIMLGKIFDMPYSKIHIHCPVIGGTFGGKDGIILEPIVALLSKKSGRPVKICYTREESMVSTYTRHAMKLYGKMAATKDGLITAFEIDSFMNSGPHCGGSINVQSAMCGKMFKLYQAPNMKFHGKTAYTNTPIGGAMRGFGSPKVFTALELLINKMAKKLEIDEVEFRMKNLVEPYDLELGTSISLGNARVKDCLLQGKELFEWEKRKQEARNKSSERYAYGVGVATALHGNGVAPFAPDITLAEIMMHEDGTLLLRAGITDHGAGTYTLAKQIVAEILDMPMDHILLVHSDTDSSLFDMGSGASRNTWTGGAAVETVAKKMKVTLMQVASEALECEEKDIILENGNYINTSGKILTKSDLVCYAYEVQKRKLIEVVSYDSKTNAGSYGAHFASVRIDKKTGEIKVEDYLAVCDVGTVLNPLLLEGQVEGAIMMGLGMALFEGLRLNEFGKVTNAHFKKYRLPKTTDMPNIKIKFLDSYEEGGPFGGKSIGEASIVPVVPAILGAINDALGSELSHLPVTSEKVLNVLLDK